MVLRSNSKKEFRSKDGRSYASYNEMRQANIRHNEAILSKKGLDPASFRDMVAQQRKPPTAEQQRKRRSERQQPAPTRSSRRIRKAPPVYEPLMDDDDHATTRVVRRQRPKAIAAANVALTEADRQTLRNEKKWIEEMEVYLRDVQHLSQPNQRSVMRQVEKLSAGLGITYHRWKNHVCFYEDKKVALDTDFGALYDEACEFEAEHGKDLGNGWLLRHPIKKLGDFQAHALANK